MSEGDFFEAFEQVDRELGNCLISSFSSWANAHDFETKRSLSKGKIKLATKKNRGRGIGRLSFKNRFNEIVVDRTLKGKRKLGQEVDAQKRDWFTISQNQ